MRKGEDELIRSSHPQKRRTKDQREATNLCELLPLIPPFFCSPVPITWLWSPALFGLLCFHRDNMISSLLSLLFSSLLSSLFLFLFSSLVCELKLKFLLKNLNRFRFWFWLLYILPWCIRSTLFLSAFPFLPLVFTPINSPEPLLCFCSHQLFSSRFIILCSVSFEEGPNCVIKFCSIQWNLAINTSSVVWSRCT